MKLFKIASVMDLTVIGKGATDGAWFCVVPVDFPDKVHAVNFIGTHYAFNFDARERPTGARVALVAKREKAIKEHFETFKGQLGTLGIYSANELGNVTKQ